MQEKNLGKKKHIADLILVASILLVSLIALLVMSLVRESGSTVRVSIDGETVAEFSLYEDAEYSINGGTNILVIEDGEAYLRYSNCPDKTCVDGNGVFGNRISYVGERIVCLPNRVMVEIVGRGEEILCSD